MLSVVLESFDRPAPPSDQINLNEAELEEMKIAAYERGYAAGWQEASASQAAEEARQQADLLQNLQGLAFGFHEARQHVLQALAPVLRDMTAKILPRIATDTLAPLIAQEVAALAATADPPPITVLTHSQCQQAVLQLLAKEPGLPLVFKNDQSLSHGQAVLRFGETEIRIDPDEAIRRIEAVLAGYFNTKSQETADG
ncbi:hypothetical protein ERN12_11090 [Rhodobacteraceae bacterium]|nr:hypothetical protein ERN12_11090 [Paracoccaceae bacterium]